MCLLGAGQNARAQARETFSCPEAFPVSPPAEAAARIKELENLRHLFEDCLPRWDYFAYQGQILLTQERFADALVALERALMLDATQLGVQLDYSVALARTGDAASARALAQQLLEGKAPPPAVRQMLEAALREGPTPPKPQSTWEWRGSVQSLLGKETNLNSATNAEAINLILPNGIVSLPLDASSKPRSGVASISTGHVMAKTSLGAGQLVFQGDWRERLASGNTEVSYRQQDASMLWRSRASNAWAARLALSSYSFGGAFLFQGQTVTAWKEISNKDCSLFAGLETERRNYAQDSTQNGVYDSAFVSTMCVNGQSNFRVGMQAGTDRANLSSRAGGNQSRLDFKAVWERQWPWARTTAEVMSSQLKDSSAYSDLLGGEVRTTHRQNLRISVIKRLYLEEKLNSWGGWYLVSALEVLRQKSNLVLFDINGESLYSGLRYEF